MLLFMATKLTEHFTLDSISAFAQNFRWPEGRFDPEGSLRSIYGVYTLAGSGGRAGRLQIRRKSISNDGFVLEMDYEKTLPGHIQHVTAEMHCRRSELSTPTRWNFNSEIRRREGGILPHTKLKKSATAEDGRITIADTDHEEHIALESEWTVNWALFDAVQRLPRKKRDPIKFAMLDHFDQFKGNQRISYREKIDITLGGRTTKLHRFDHLGEGIVPWVYWVDDRGRLLFAVSGLEAYILETQASVQTDEVI